MKNVFYHLINFINTYPEDDIYGNAARIILLNIKKIPALTIIDVAELCFVSTATISRLARKLNYESFLDFKADIVLCVGYIEKNGDESYAGNSLPVDCIQDFKKVDFKNHFDHIIDDLETTFDIIDFELLEHIVDKIHTSNTVALCGNFFCQTASMQLQIELSYNQKQCSGYYDYENQLKSIDSLTDEDVLIVSSITGNFIRNNHDFLRKIMNCPAYKIYLSQDRSYSNMNLFDCVVQLGKKQGSLLGKFSTIYAFELLEALYHIKYVHD